MTWTTIPSWTFVRATDPDDIDVAPDDHVHPDAAFVANLDVADDLGTVVDVGGRVNARQPTAVGTEHSS